VVTSRLRLSLGPSHFGLAIIALSLVLLPGSSRAIGPTASFLPAMLAIVACFDLLSMYLLITDFADTGDARVLAMSGAYLWSLVLMTGYALAFPGVFSSTPPLAASPSTAPWLYVGWHVGFPVLLGLAWAPWPRRAPHRVDRSQRGALAWGVVAGSAAVAVSVVAGCVVFARHMPVLIVGVDTGLMTKLTAPVALPLVVAALALSRRELMQRTGPERWSTAAILICFCDLIVTYVAGSRYTLGWYFGRTLTMAGAGIVLFAMLSAFRHLKMQAELHAATDALTGLPNRRSLEETLRREAARAKRLGTPLSVLLLDLDGFKKLNDVRGHAAGDAALRAAAKAWTTTLRASDLLARTGGDEFVVVLPDADATQARHLASRLKRATPEATGGSIGQATGAGSIDPEALLASADRDMYRDKSAHSAGNLRLQPSISL
jgi:diguanylate cyclase (GGDEF)-like protein